MLQQFTSLLKKDLKTEWRTQRIVNEALLYLVIVIFICYFSFSLYGKNISIITWNIIFWLISIFSATIIVDKTFGETYSKRYLFYYTLVPPSLLIFSKIILNSLFLILVFFVNLCIYTLIMGNYVRNWGLFVLILVSSGFTFASILTLISGISAQTKSPTTITVILGFPLLLPTLLTSLKMTKHVIDNLPSRLLYDEFAILVALIVITSTISIVFFPYLWRK